MTQRRKKPTVPAAAPKSLKPSASGGDKRTLSPGKGGELDLARRVRRALARHRHIQESRLFGGIGFLHRGHLLVALWMDRLIARVGPETGSAFLGQDGVELFDPTGHRPIKGWLAVEPLLLDTEDRLVEWLDRALAFVTGLPPKPGTEESMEEWVARSLDPETKTRKPLTNRKASGRSKNSE